jgi:hypothetical protein
MVIRKPSEDGLHSTTTQRARVDRIDHHRHRRGQVREERVEHLVRLPD